MKIYEITEAEDETFTSSEFPKIRSDVKKNVNGQPHIGIEYANGDMWIVPQASDGKPVFTNKSIESNDLLKRQLRAKGIGFPLKYDGDYDKRDGKWMNQDDVWDYDNNAEANSPYAKAQEQNKADLAAAGVDFEEELAKAQEAGKYPDPRIEGPDDFMAYLMQKAGVEDNTPSRYQLKGFGHDMDDDGYDFKDTSQYIEKGATAGDKSGNTALDMLRTMQRRDEPAEPATSPPDAEDEPAEPVLGDEPAEPVLGDEPAEPATSPPDAEDEPAEPSITMPDGSRISGVTNTNTKRTTTTRSGSDDFDDLENDIDDAFRDIDNVERVRRQGQANVDRVRQQGQANIDRIRRLAGLD
jgi:hypothetical protein